MEESKKPQNELNDILIKRESLEGSRLKNILLIVAALLLFAIIGILAFRIIDSSAKDTDSKPTIAKEEPKDESSPKFGVSSAPEAKETARSLEDMLAKHRGEKLKEEEANTSVAEEVVPKIAIEEEKIDLADQGKFVDIKEEPKKVVEPKKEPVKTVVKPEPKQTVVQKESPKTGHFYVQVESLSKEPRSDYIKELKSKGFGVVIKDKIVEGKSVKRVYVGPYNTREEAAAVLSKVKGEINENAFVIQD